MFFDDWLVQKHNPNQLPLSQDNRGTKEVTLLPNHQHHYVVSGKINNNDETITFLLDTGATDVALPESVARALGLEFGPKVQVMTAAGPAIAWMTRLDEVNVGGIRRRNVRASITSGEFNGILLGMSFLKHYNLQQQDGKLVISQDQGSVINE